ALQMIFLNSSIFSGFVNHPNYSRSNILVRTSLSRPSEVTALLEQIQAFTREHFPAAELNAHPTGSLILYTRTTGGLISGEIQSLALTAGVIFLIMVAMFLSIRLSTFVPVQEFGFLSAATIIVGLASEVVLLPALLATTPIITLWNVLYLKLGRDPHKTIQLFEGLRPFQAKIVTLMGELKSFSQGQPIVRQGELGNEMYVLI